VLSVLILACLAASSSLSLGSVRLSGPDVVPFDAPSQRKFRRQALPRKLIEPVEPPSSAPFHCCFTIPVTSNFTRGGTLWTYYSFLIEFAAPMLRTLSAKDPAGLKKTLILPGWRSENFKDKIFGSVQPADRFYLTRPWDPVQSMQHHADFLFGPIGVDIVNWKDSLDSYKRLPCEVLNEWNPRFSQLGFPEAEALQFLRAYGHKLAGIHEGWKWVSGPPRVVLVRRSMLSNATCTGQCKSRLPEGFFKNATIFLRDNHINYKVIETDQMRLVDQIRAFSEATIIVGLEGGGLFNAVFSRPGTLVIEIVPKKKNANLDYNETIAFKLGIDHWKEARTGGLFNSAISGLIGNYSTTQATHGPLNETTDVTTASFAATFVATTMQRISSGVQERQANGSSLVCYERVQAVLSNQLPHALLPSFPRRELDQEGCPCFKLSSKATTSMEGGFFEYYHFIVELAAPISYSFRSEPKGKKVLVLPGWDHDDKFDFVFRKNPLRNMTAQAQFFFCEGMEVQFSYWMEDKESYDNSLPCKELDWYPGREDRLWSRDSPLVYRYFRNFAQQLAFRGASGGASGGDEGRGAAAANRTHHLTAAGNPGVQLRRQRHGSHHHSKTASRLAPKIVLIRRMAPIVPTTHHRHRDVCFGACRRHEAPGFFENATLFLEARSIPFVIAELETMSIRDQITLFASARTIVGIHGAGLSNMLFASPGAHIIELAVPWPDKDCYRNLAFQKLDHMYTLCKTLEFNACVQDSILEAWGLSPRTQRWMPELPTDAGVN